MSAADGLLTIVCNRDFPPGHAELLREDGSVLATHDSSEGAEAALDFSLSFEDAATLVVAPDLYSRFSRLSGRGTVH